MPSVLPAQSNVIGVLVVVVDVVLVVVVVGELVFGEVVVVVADGVVVRKPVGVVWVVVEC